MIFDPNSDTPQLRTEAQIQDLKDQMVAAMRKAGIRNELIYAFEKTGLMPTESTTKTMPGADREEWNAAMKEYRDQHPEEE